jgi:hypothetical protein
LFAVTVLAFGVAVFTQSIAGAIIVFLIGLCLAFVLATAWMRPSGSPKEHHAPSDRILNDTSP